MTAGEMWETYSKANHITADYDSWAFGDDADELARLVREGSKTATSSAYPLYALEGEDLPKTGQYSVILNTREEAVCIILTKKVFVVPFCDVDERQAFKEGEGDRSLAHWRKVHEKFFSEELKNIGMTFDSHMKVVCEEFETVYSG